MKKEQALFLILVVTLCSCQPKSNFDPAQCFSQTQNNLLLRQAVRYSTKLPPGANHETKFNQEFDWYYDEAAREYDIRGCSPAGEGRYFILMTRKARSIWPAREGIGGKIAFDKENVLIEYEEMFRTWKMAEDTLNARAFELFDLLVKGEDLTPFRSKYKGDRYIEFPDDRSYFDKKEKRWRDRVMDSLKRVSDQPGI